jgi:hypothetical protein
MASPRSRLAVGAFGLNAAWEVAHWPLYECAWSSPVIAAAAGVDAAVTLGIAEVASLARPRSEAGFWLALVAGLGGAAATIELRALRGRRRAYASRMPRVGRMGVTPLVQLPALGVLAVALADDGGHREKPQT